MFSRLAIAVFIFCGARANAQATIESLYDARSRVPGVLIPFQVNVTSGSLSLVSIAALPTEPSDCRAMLDPYRPSIFLLKCTEVTDVMLRVRLITGSKPYEITYGPVSIRELGDSLEPIDPDPPPEDPNVLAGRQLYNTYCINCHNPPSLKRGRTASQIQGSFTSVPTMASLAGQLSADEVAKIAAYLGTL